MTRTLTRERGDVQTRHEIVIMTRATGWWDAVCVVVRGSTMVRVNWPKHTLYFRRDSLSVMRHNSAAAVLIVHNRSCGLHSPSVRTIHHVSSNNAVHTTSQPRGVVAMHHLLAHSHAAYLASTSHQTRCHQPYAQSTFCHGPPCTHSMPDHASHVGQQW